MRITDVQVIILRYEYPPNEGFSFCGGYCAGRLSCLVRIHTDAGISGTGSVYSHPELVRTIVEGPLRDLLSGEDPCDVEALWDCGYGLTRWYGRKGAAVSALGGVDTALWDIRGKAAGRPVFQLLGGVRDRVPAYASALLWKDDPAKLADEAARHVAWGFRAMKMRLGRDYDYDCAAIRGVRERVGPDVRLMVDGNARYTLAQAERISPVLRSCGVFWFEEPFLPENPDSFLALRPSVGIPLAAGENEFGLQGFRELVDRRIVDIVQPDCSRSGGITECRRIAALAARHDLPVATHSWSDAVALVANAHLVASLPNGLTVEIDRTGNPLVDELLSQPLQLENGELVLPQGPGLGIELSEDALRRYSLPRGEAIPPGNYSDMVFGRGFYKPAPAYEPVPLEV
ncbi:MAG: mandelate racemase/muconate lactonizing enzyme family protein [Acidobacteria bacterium]|nr:mandelate racemase/muconate lactonizing enzyme family protein [Acidobacteriota bacterium]